MSRARDLADFISSGNTPTGILADGAIDSTEITGVTVSSAEINRLAGVTSDVQTQINTKAATSSLAAVATSGAYADVTGTPSLGTAAALNVGTAASNIPQLDGTGKLPAIDGSQLTGLGVTQGTLTKTFTQNETADITLSQSITSAPVVSATKEVPQTGVSTKGNWDVNSTASNYDFHNTAPNVTLTPSTVQVANVSLATYANKASGSLGFTGLRGVWFKPDGTKMFTMDRQNAQIVQQNLSTAWDVSTQSNSGSYFQFTSGITTSNQPYGLWFNSDGTKLFVNNLSRIVAFTLSTAWDLSTISIVSNGDLSTSSYDNNTRGIFFKADGSRVYVVGIQTNTVYEYEIPTAWDLTSVVNEAASRQFSVSSQANSARDIYFNSTGTTFYIVNDNGYIYEYSLSTAWDISTASYTNNSFDTSSQGNGAQAMFLGNGNMYVVNDGTNQAYQYNFSGAGVVLGSGSFASTDVGKRIVGNGGDVILTSTGGTYSTTGGSAFTDNSTIAAGSWSMFGLKSAGDADGLTISGLSVAGTVSTKDVFTNSEALYQMDNSLNDTGGNYNLSGSQTFSTDAKYGSHSFSSGSSNDFTIPFNQPSGGPWTLSFWFKRNGISGLNNNNRMVDFKEHTSSQGSTISFESDQKFHFILRYNNSYWTTYGSREIGGTSICDNQWHHIVVGSGTGGYIPRVYVDGTAVTSNSGKSRSDSNEGTGIVFADGYGGRVTNAYFDQVRFFTKELSASEVNTLYTETGGTHTQPTQQYHVGVTNTSGRIDSSAFQDINSMTAAQSAGTGTAHYAVSTDGRTTWSVAKGTDGVRPIVRNNSGTWQYNTAVGVNGYDLSLGSYDSVSLSISANETDLTDGVMGDNGTKLYVIGSVNDTVYQYNLSTANDLSTATYANKSFSVNSQSNDPRDIAFKTDGTKMYILARAGFGTMYQYSLSTAWDVSTASYDNVAVSHGSDSQTDALTFSPDGTKAYVCGTYLTSNVYQKTMSTAWDLSTLGSSSYFDINTQVSDPTSIEFNSDGTKMFIFDQTSRAIYEYDLSTAYDVTTASYNNVSLSTTQDTTPKGGMISSDGSKIYMVGNQNDTVYQYTISTTAYTTSTTWVDGTTNDELYTLQQALSVGINRMDKTQLDAVADANHFTLGNSLDLMIALRMDTAASTLPTSDGVTLNYDAAALNEGAVLGTDYDFFFPANNKVQIKSLAAQNLKVRVV